MAEETGRPTDLTDDVFDKLQTAILAGKSLKNFANENGIEEATVYNWSYKNYLGFADKVEGWKRDRKLLLADVNIEKILQLDVENKDYTRTVGDMTKFVKETLDKRNYSKRTELGGIDGKDLQITVVSYADKKSSDGFEEGEGS